MYELTIQILAIIGFLISSYAFYLEIMFHKNKKHIALCDISNKISCSKPLKSRFSSTFGVPNALWGALLYTGIFVLVTLGFSHIVFLTAVAMVLFSFYLAYILFFIVNSYCVVCISVYSVNFIILIVSYLNLWNIH